MAEIDFLPADYCSRRASRRDQWYVIGLGAVLVVVLLGSMLRESHEVRSLRVQLGSLEVSRSDSQAQRTELQRLEARRAELALDAKFYCLLNAHASVSRVLVALSTCCPPRLTLHTLRLKPVKQNLTEGKTGRKAARNSAPEGTEPPEGLRVELIKRFGEQRMQAGLNLDITGVAEYDIAAVAKLMELLDDSDCFVDVELGNTDDQKASTSSLREFTIHCRLSKLL